MPNASIGGSVGPVRISQSLMPGAFIMVPLIISMFVTAWLFSLILIAAIAALIGGAVLLVGISKAPRTDRVVPTISEYEQMVAQHRQY